MRAGDRALVVALHEHDALPQRERRVPADVAHRAPRALLVARDQLGARGEALGARDVAERARAAPLPGRRPRSTSCTGSRGRRAGRRSSPSPSRAPRPGAPARSARTSCCRGGSRRGRSSPARSSGRFSASQPPTLSTAGISRVLFSSHRPAEAPQLAFEVAGRLAEALEPGRPPVDGVDLDSASISSSAMRRRSRGRVRARPGRSRRSPRPGPAPSRRTASRSSSRPRTPPARRARARACCCSARSSRASRSTSCALGGSGGRGGRRSTTSLPPRSIR